MRNHIIKLCYILFLISISSVTYGQSWFGFGAKNEPTSIVLDQTPATPVLSPDAFRNKVNSLSKQTNADLNQQVSQQLNTKKSMGIAPPMNTIDSSDSTNDQSMGEASTSITTQSNPQTGTTTTTVNTNPSPSNQLPPSSSTTVVAPSTPIPSQPDIYTGFGAGQTKSDTQKNNTSTGAGLGIKY